MMKVLQINTVYANGSTGRIVASIEKVCKESEIEPLVACGGGIETVENHYAIGGWMSSHIHAHIYSKLFDAQGFGSFISTKMFLRWIDSIQPDIIHLHNIHGNYINIHLLFNYIKKHNIPIVWTFHDCWPITGHCTHFDYIGCEKWKEQCNHCPLTKEYPSSLIDCSQRNYLLKKKLFSSIPRMTIVPVSKWLEGKISNSFLNMYPTKVIYNGINLEIFRPTDNDVRERYGINNKKILLGVGTSWSDMKGLKEFIELSKLPQYQVILVGVNDEMKNSLPHSIISISRTNSQKELADFYSTADVLVNPTYNDSFPTVNIESLACGTPIVTYRTGGSPESIHSGTGVVIERGDFKSLVNSIGLICSKDKSVYKKSCIENARLYFDEKLCYQHYLELYRSI